MQSPGGSEIVLGNLSLAVSGSCPVEIGSFSDDPCPSAVTIVDGDDDDDDDVGAIVGGVIGGVVLIVIIIVVIVIIILIIKSRRTKKWEPKK